MTKPDAYPVTPPNERESYPAPSKPPPLAVYIHVPWCVRKCPYCDFNSHPQRGALPERAFVAALAEDLAHDAALVSGRTVTSIFFGGGTPSLLSPDAIAAILQHVHATLSIAANAEVTLEANPGATEIAALSAWRDAGVNRVSIGVQSLDPVGLAELGRIHDAPTAERTVAAALEVFPRVNADLIYGWPGQTPQGAEAEVMRLLALGIAHVSAYELTIEPNTPFAAAPPAGLPDETRLGAIEAAVHAVLAGAGFTRYEVSAFAKPDHRARHNLNYWTFGDYLGIGPGAHGKISFPGSGILRTRKRAHPNDYLSAGQHRNRPDRVQGLDTSSVTNPYTAAAHWVQADALPFEFLMNALRLAEGVPRPLFTERTGLPFAAIADTWERLAARGWVVDDAARLACTPLGWRYLNTVLEAFLDPMVC